MTQQQNPVAQNQMARYNLLSTGIAMNSQLQPVKGNLGDTMRIPLRRMGIMTGVVLHFTVPVDIKTSAATASLVAPWNLAKTVSYTDFSGTQRTRTNGYQLWAAQSMKQGDALGVSPVMAQGVDLDYNTDIFSLPTAVGEGEIRFSLYVPMAYDPTSDLTGAVLTSTNVGEHYISIQLPNTLVGADGWGFPYTAGTVDLNGQVTVEAFQFYIQPQSMDAASLPVLDLSTVYGFEGAYESAENIVTGQDKYINYPNNRSILSTLISYQNGGQFKKDGVDISRIQLIANSNTSFQELTPRLNREIMRNIVNCDLPPSTYYLGSRRQPIMTQLYANVQAILTMKQVDSGITKTISQFEVMYPSGAPLPGVTIAA